MGAQKSLDFTEQGPIKAKMAIFGGPELVAGNSTGSANLQVTFRRRVEITCKFSARQMFSTARTGPPKMAIFAVFVFGAVDHFYRKVNFTPENDL